MTDLQFLEQMIKRFEHAIKTWKSLIDDKDFEILNHLKSIRDKIKDFTTYHDSDPTEFRLKDLLKVTNSRQDIFLNTDDGRLYEIHDSSDRILKEYEDYKVIYIQTDYDHKNKIDTLTVVVSKPTDD